MALAVVRLPPTQLRRHYPQQLQAPRLVVCEAPLPPHALQQTAPQAELGQVAGQHQAERGARPSVRGWRAGRQSVFHRHDRRLASHPLQRSRVALAGPLPVTSSRVCGMVMRNATTIVRLGTTTRIDTARVAAR